MRSLTELERERQKCLAKAKTCRFPKMQQLWSDRADILWGEICLQEAWEGKQQPKPMLVAPKRRKRRVLALAQEMPDPRPALKEYDQPIDDRSGILLLLWLVLVALTWLNS